MELGKPKEAKIDVADQKTKLSNISKMLAKKATSREKLSKAEFSHIKQNIKVSNGIGLRMVDKQQSVEALDLLKQAESVALLLLRIVEQNTTGQPSEELNPVLKLLANTYNNIGYLFSQAGNMENAYAYLLRTLEAESRCEYSNFRKGLTCLNLANLLISKKLSITFSEMQKFKETVKFANRAVEEFTAALTSGGDLDSPDVNIR